MEIQELKEEYGDWHYVMQYGPDVEEVAEVVRFHDGERDYESWYLVLRMKDGRWCHVTAWCDYTGWGCQEGGDHYFASTEEELVRTCLDQSARRTLGYEETPEELL
jgi:hypothetical protein